MADGFRELERELGARAPAGFRALDDDQLAVLREALAGARREQHLALARAVDDSLRFIPRVLRGPVKRVLR